MFAQDCLLSAGNLEMAYCESLSKHNFSRAHQDKMLTELLKIFFYTEFLMFITTIILTRQFSKTLHMVDQMIEGHGTC